MDRRDAESRRNAVAALTDVVCLLGVCHSDSAAIATKTDTQTAPTAVTPLGRTAALTVFQTLLRCLTDYATDDRGDVGRWAREAGMRGLLRCALLYAETDRQHPGTDLCVVFLFLCLLTAVVVFGINVQIWGRCGVRIW